MIKTAAEIRSMLRVLVCSLNQGIYNSYTKGKISALAWVLTGKYMEPKEVSVWLKEVEDDE